MAFAGVTIDIVDKASRKLEQINNASKKLGRSFTVLEKRNKGITTKFNGLAKAIAAVGLVEFGRRSVQTAANFEKLNVRLKLLTEQTGTFARSQEIAAEAQRLFGISSTEALDGITNITARLAPLGTGVEDIRTTFIGFNTAAKLAGASSIEASNAFRQLAQALGSGRLQGDEFRSLAEQVPTLLAPIAKELNTTVGGLKKFAAEGKLTSDVVIRALKKIEQEGAPALAALLENDPTQVFKNLQNEIEDLQITVGKALLPAAKFATESLTILADTINSIPPEITSFVVVTGTLVTALTLAKPVIVAIIGTLTTLKTIAAGVALVLGGPLTVAITGLAALIGKFTYDIYKNNKAQKELEQLLESGTEAAINERIAVEKNTLSQLLNTDARGNAKRGIQRQIKEQQKLIDKLEEEAKVKKRIEKENKEIADRGTTYTVMGTTYDFAAEGGKSQGAVSGAGVVTAPKDLTKEEKAAANKIVELKRSIQLKQTEDDTDRRILERKFELIDNLREINKIKDDKTRIEALSLANTDFELDKQDILNGKLKEQVNIAKELGDTLESSLVENIKGAINGTQSFGQAMTNVLNNIKNKLMDRALSNLFSGIGDAVFGDGGKNKGIFGGLLGGIFGKKAKGGPVRAGKSYLVGERGPELFTPASSGNITANNKMGGGSVNISVAVDASGSTVQGDGASANQLGNEIAAAIQNELIKQKRAGRLLA